MDGKVTLLPRPDAPRPIIALVAHDRRKDEMVEWFRSAPMGSRHERMLWATRKIAHLTMAAEGGAYKRLLIAMIEAEGRLDPREFKDCA